MILPNILNFLSQTAPPPDAGLYGTIGWALLAAIIVGFLLFGMRDLSRLSWMRISALSSVAFDESIRRKVLWVTPLAILGAIVVSLLQNAVDPQDSIRQTTKICLFATGLVVTLVSVILASTNLQKEIETRVIFTIVTKPTTRLEIVLGKVWGFAKVSAAILLIMGLFTYGYLHVRSWQLRSAIANTLESLPADAVNRQTLEFYQQAGMLNAKAMTLPTDLQMLATAPVDGQPRWMAGGQGQKFLVKYTLTPDDLAVVKDSLTAGGRVELQLSMPVTIREPTKLEQETIRLSNVATIETPVPTTGPTTTTAPSTSPTTAPTVDPATTIRPVPAVGVAFRSIKGEPIIPSEEFNKGAPIEVPGDGSTPVRLVLSPAQLDKLFEIESFFVVIEGRSPAVHYSVADEPITIEIFKGDGTIAATLKPLPESKRPRITGSFGRYGQQLIGGPEGYGGIALYHFDRVGSSDGANLNFEIKTGIERGGDSEGDVEILPEAYLQVRNPENGKLSEPVPFRPETNRISYVSVPRDAFPASGGAFDVLVRVTTHDQWLGVSPDSVLLATASRSFAFNLFKSLLILWLMSILVVSIAMFCSTFVSWPIAVVLTLVLLLGHWGVKQIGDAGELGIGSVVTGQTQDVAKARLVRSTVDSLAKVLTVVSAFLPDIGQFEATTDIERGISVPLARLGAAALVLLGYGVPMVILSYLILRRKEVAP